VLFCLAVAFAHAGEAGEELRLRFDSQAQSGRMVVGDALIYSFETVHRFYDRRGYLPAWSDERGFTTMADRLLQVIGEAEAEGLRPTDYHLDAMRQIRADFEATRDAQRRIRLRTDFDLLATDAFMTLGAHYLAGRLDPVTVDPQWHATRRATDMSHRLSEALRTQTVYRSLKEMLPPQAEYAQLREELARFRAIAARATAWPRVPDGPSLELGSTGPRVVALKDRLGRFGYYEAPEDESEDAAATFGADLRDAVIAFQRRYSLADDGVVGPRTLAALNASLDDRINQIMANMERWRWLPESLGARHIRVNIAGFDVRVFDQGEQIWITRAIVGRTYRRTPVFTGSMTYMVLNPSWELPNSIAVRDKLPLIKRDISVLNDQKIAVLQGWGANERVIDPATVNWNELSSARFPYRLRQRPGPQNALGQVKFMFPNRFNVYLHDTPTRGLFARARRDFSSGCIRTENPLELAELLLKGQEGWSRERIDSILASGRETTVTLSRPVPVHILYWTAVVEDGRVHFHDDIYERDGRVVAALKARPPQP
jgi:murein L,D-transpeptidase YcbB/YkuD